MATSHSTKETTNYARLCRLLVDVSAHVLRETFDKKRPSGNLLTVLLSPPVRNALQLLRKKKVLNPSQWGKLYPAITSSVSSKNFDITLLMVLLRNICSLVPPATGWDTLPPEADTTLEADIVRIKCYRNTVYGHATEASVNDTTFNQYWKDIQDALVRLGGAEHQGVIEDLKNECMDPEIEEHYIELLKQWEKDEVSIKDEIGKIFRKLDERRESTSNPEKKIGVEDVAAYTNALKESIKSQTEFHTVASPTSSKVRTDDIFTSILIQHGRKPVEDRDMEREERLHHYSQVSGKPVEHCQEIFTSDTDLSEERNPKSVLVTGKAGIGKTLFCQKLIRDWADNKLFLSRANLRTLDFKFAYLLTFRQLNLLGNDCITLREILNRSSAIDDRANIDDSLFEYIVDHSEEVLIIIDGYDEYAQQHFIASELDDRHSNDVHEKMPVAALCAKLLKGKILNGSVVMITSRPDESDEIKHKIGFDRCVEITGFSEEQVKEFIERYFQKNEVIKNAVIDHITKNDNLVSFAHIPVLCFLMCSYFEHILTKSISTDALPVNMSDIYYEVVEMFLKKHSKKRGKPLKVTLEKLSKLAANFLRENKFVLADEDIKDFTDKEVESLRTSGLLHCGPTFRKTFSETTKYFCFTHLTLQEYLAAKWYVESKEIPSLGDVSEMVFIFMSGILSKQNDKALMQTLIDRLNPKPSRNLLTLKCLTEYQDIKFAQGIVKRYYDEIWHQDGNISFGGVLEVDCIAVSFLLHVINSLNVAVPARKNQTSLQQTRIPLVQRLNPFKSTFYRNNSIMAKRLTIMDGRLSQTGLRGICRALENKSCSITELVLIKSQITNAGVVTLCETLQTVTRGVTTLNLSGNSITNKGVASLSIALQTACRVTTLDLSENWIHDDGVDSLCQALQKATCQVTTLHLSGNQITDAGVYTLCQALQTATCRVTTLHLSGSRITNAGVVSLSQVLEISTCRVTTLHLGGYWITDAGFVRLCQALQTATCQVTTLHLSSSRITNAGVDSLCQALQTATCQVTTLHLSGSRITDAGVVSLCQALQTATCQVTTLDLSGNEIAEAGVVSLCQALQTATSQVRSLNLERNFMITNAGGRLLNDLLKKLPNLDLRW
ncbi:NACHT, LRR and PYD domains-containing protein 3-like [Stylophora pistillata]|uniref:NACHT, LRR and PYD domains-containing protein 3-like n=1 Tax=Stylophora pistillata TaxID=50429 RepID=UPI000C054586|nr:NACHT, LRR and PYD domains-containing protein 3-like [Stylophora pistillata]